GHAVCVQILARPVTGRRVARATRSAASTGTRAGVAAGLLCQALDLLTPGSNSARTSRATAGAGTGRASDRQTSLEYSAAARAAAAKARGAHWETVVRYAASI
ncbi:type VI secretion protein, partial [Nocardia cyriacigeorgica]|nr:type VI secretion protein [Nocardia cyriacigeorgica]